MRNKEHVIARSGVLDGKVTSKLSMQLHSMLLQALLRTEPYFNRARLSLGQEYLFVKKYVFLVFKPPEAEHNAGATVLLP